MHFSPFGRNGLLINFDQKIEPEINEQVIAWSKTIENSKIQGIQFITPAYCSITIGFDLEKTSFSKLKDKIRTLPISSSEFKPYKTYKKFNIPVCYETPYSIDLQEVNTQTTLTSSEIIKIHTSTLFRVFMIGFLPGFPYLGTLPDSLRCTRKNTPRLRVPKESVAIAGQQTGIYPSEAPGGWQIIGRTPIPIFDVQKENPFLLEAGDHVQFQSISSADFTLIEKDYQNGSFDLNNLLQND